MSWSLIKIYNSAFDYGRVFVSYVTTVTCDKSLSVKLNMNM